MSDYEQNLKRLAAELPKSARPQDGAEKVCPSCAETIKAGAIKCRYCGANVGGLPAQGSMSSRTSREDGIGWVTYVVSAVVGIVVVLFAFGHFHAQDPAVRARVAAGSAIEECRKQQADELSDLSTRRFVRGVCDRMEQEFRQKYGMSP